MLAQHRLLTQDLESVVQDSRVFQVNDTAVGARLKVKFHHLAFGIVVCTKVIAHRLFFQIQVLCDARDAAMRQSVFDATKFFKSKVHKHKCW